MKRTGQPHRFGFTLVEMLISMAMLATLTTSSFVLIRTSYTAWNRHELDCRRQQAAVAVLRHLVRYTRQAVAVSSISPAADLSGALTITMADSSQRAWDHVGATKEMRFGTAGPTDLLATGIESFKLIGIEADGITPTEVVTDIHSVRCIVQYYLPRAGGDQLKTISSQAWLRSW